MHDPRQLAAKAAQPFLRFSLGLILLWIGLLKFADPAPVVGLLEASLSFLAFNGFVYLLGVVEVLMALALFFNVATRHVSVVLVGLFAGTLLIFLMAPSVSFAEAGFPYLSLAGEFLLKDLVLLAAVFALFALEADAEPQHAKAVA